MLTELTRTPSGKPAPDGGCETTVLISAEMETFGRIINQSTLWIDLKLVSSLKTSTQVKFLQVRNSFPNPHSLFLIQLYDSSENFPFF